jgi:hypothetical protein
MSQEIVACCGLVCSSCPAYLASQANDEAAAKAVAEEWSKNYGVDCRVEHVWCDGCTLPGRKCAHCGECEIRSCCVEHGLANCSECPDYPCGPLTGFFRMVPAAQAKLDSLRIPG